MMSTVSEKLLQVAENVPKVYHAGQLNVIENAECLKGDKSDTAILIDDVSPVTHEMGVRIKGKNLLPPADSGIYYNGSIAGGNPFIYNSSYGISDFNNINISINRGVYAVIRLTEGETYTLTINNLVNNCATKQITFAVGFRSSESTIFGTGEANNAVVSKKYNPSSFTFTVPNGYPYCLVGFFNYPTVSGDTVSFDAMQLELGSTATDYTPYVPDLTAVKVTRCGKNVLSEMSLYPTVTNNAVPIHFKAGQQYTISFTTTYTAWRLMFFGTDKNGTAFDNSSPDANKYISGTYTGTTGRLQHASNQSGNTLTFTCNEDCTITAIVFWNVANETNKTYSNFQLEIGTTATEYEPYKECAEYIPNADGTVNGVTSLYPNTTLMTDTEGVTIDCEYYKDIDKAYNKLSAEIALSGGE